ncbi:cysteine/glutathione ABC transporter ATP-binding protein/permease CydC [Pasteurella skyensis]|uniref:Cysteine/glutathione ABC transporter ATP-binding protein/permease CydC n=1 Tax=Phocoenobacter skyensis TaxID=97481 RepID=A0AAJ6N8Z5_9PAST|nr:cysteine/glutathione ABC transporter ATP-binding protein/permease CydC [Pasteurella skyensis]MDP8162467.1 cysteine/glutathione ABC transporter ATP-binding protein/permease CydC [Pasteurella skyensis]MDP8172432.1 cysteine/glutathione ABC transporter ATP-binding protein/permease CydC [Pasteurella skyensis]MDP8177457.1 cysteine/glutathione ABC transporter ATP-binding protein/permease CydC [Pasteurella skyensis]MDP8178687.1 cysteine/glutathione ABC transporter ATP-binding protein/permease CydC [
MRSLFPFLALLHTHTARLALGVILAITSLSASIGLLSLSGWFLAASSLVGSVIFFNFFYPSSGVRGLAIGRTVSRYFERIVSHDATFRVLATLRMNVFKKLIPLSPAELNQYRNSELLNIMVADVDTLDTLYLNLISPFISAIAVILFMGFGLWFISPLFTFIICGTLLTLLLIFPTVFYHLGKKTGQTIIQSRSTYRSQFVEWIQLQSEFLLFGVQQQATEKLQQTEQQWLNSQSQQSKLGGLSNALLIALNGILVTLVVLLSATIIQLPNIDNAGALIALVVFCTLASLEILTPIGAAFLHLGQVITAAQRLTNITNQTAIAFGHQEWNETHFLQKDDRKSPLIQFEKIQFSYSTQQNLFNALSFEVYKGEKVAILGATGSGKTTLFQLLNRNYAPTSGHITLNNCKIEEYSENALRQNMITLNQKVHIFSSTLRDNLLIANQKASDEVLCNQLNKVGLSHLIEQKEGLDLWLGDGGRPLSGGEQRRLGLARVLLHPAQIILLDEPTEGLDRETEQQILNLILEQCRDKTILMITHRLSQLSRFDRIYHLDNGTITYSL